MAPFPYANKNRADFIFVICPAFYIYRLHPHPQLPFLRNLFVEDFNAYHIETITNNAATEFIIFKSSFVFC